MARIRIELPQNPIAVFTIPVRITDINYGNHVGNNSLVEIIHEARMQLLLQHGFTEMEAGGTSLIMNELVVDFKNEAFYKDTLEIKIFVGEISRVICSNVLNFFVDCFFKVRDGVKTGNENSKSRERSMGERF